MVRTATRSGWRCPRWIAGPMIFLLACGCAAEQSHEGSDRDPAGLAITGVRVVTMENEEIRADQTVLIEHGHVLRIGPSARVRVPEHFEVIEGHDDYLAPGLADMHAHVTNTAELDLYLANGITFLRVMWGAPVVLELRDAVESGSIRGPRIYTSGPIIDGEPPIQYGTDQVVTEDDARQVVRAQKESEYDFLKVYSNLSPAAFDAIASEAKDSGVAFAGHVPDAVPLAHAVESGMASMEHLFGLADATVADPARKIGRRYQPGYAEFAAKIGRGELDSDEVFDRKKLEEVAEVIGASGTWTVPTLALLDAHALSEQQRQRHWQSVQMQFVPPGLRNFWRTVELMLSSSAVGYAEGQQRLFELDLTRIKVLHEAGAGLLAGTDALNPFVYQGSSMVRELELFVQAGLSPFEAIKTATVNAAEFLGQVGEMGVVREGARADLVLLDSNPLENVGAYRDIEGVIAQGRWLSRRDLNDVLSAIARQNAQLEATFDGAPEWELASADPQSTAAYLAYVGDDIAGAERIGFVGVPDGGRRIVSQELKTSGESWLHDLVLDRQGTVKSYLLRRSTSDGASEVIVERIGEKFVRTGPDGKTESIEDETELFLSGTLADWLVLQNSIADMDDLETREIVAGYLDDEQRLGSRRLSITRRPSEVIVGHFYLAGANPHDVTIRSQERTIGMTVWIGGGFYSGWPLKLSTNPGADDEPAVLFKRYL